TAATTLEDELEWLQQEKPDYLVTQPGRALGLSRAALAAGRPAHPIRHVITMGETVDAATRRAVREAFGAEVKDIYSTKELGYLALQCPRHEHYYALTGSVLLEI